MLPASRPLTRHRQLVLGFVAGGLLIVLAWSGYTQHVWEDFLITYRASRNAALGHGLVYNVGDRLQTFTSPLHTLLMAGLALIAGTQEDPTRVLWLYRIVGGCAFGGALYWLYRLGGQRGWRGLTLLATLGLVALDWKSIDFAANGMETPLLLFFLAWHLYEVLAGSGWRRLGVAWAGMMWTRPDAFIFILATLAAALVFGCADGAERRKLLGRTLRGGAFGAALYAPWLIFATAYYGTPIPHTIVAKGANHAATWPLLRAWALSPWKILVYPSYLLRVYAWRVGGLPIPYSPEILHFAGRAMGLVPWAVWLVPFASRSTRLFSFAFFLAFLYCANAPYFLWYTPPYEVLASVTWGLLLADLWRRTEKRKVGEPTNLATDRRRSWLRWVWYGLAAALLAVQGGTSLAFARTMRWHQVVIENGNRREIGRWLKAHAAPDETVFVECIGYIGYYSNLKLFDFPGLTSREVVAARERLHTDDYGLLIADLQPDWLVLRPWEAAAVRHSSPQLLSDKDGTGGEYELRRVFDRSREVATVPRLLGRAYFDIDKRFEVYHRRGAKSGLDR